MHAANAESRPCRSGKQGLSAEETGLTFAPCFRVLFFMHIFFLGYPGAMGGANTECLHTAAVWRREGIEVTFIPTWGCDKGMEDRLAAMGCKTVHAGNPENLKGVAGLAGSVVAGMCNQHYHASMGVLRELGCKLVFSNCMTFLFDTEVAAYHRQGLPDAMHFQSEFQRATLEPILATFGYKPEQGHLIRGAFDFDALPFAPRPHKPGTEFVIGRLSRPDQDKWSSNLWPILWKVPYVQRRAVAMGWNQGLDHKCGQAPPWAETLAPQQIPVAEFLGRCHAMLGLNGGARENWPRIGLEAMAAGVPIVAQDLWGWREMLVDGQTGFLTNSDEEMAFRLAQLAYDEQLRQAIIERARAQVHDLACPERIGKQWVRLFASLGA